MTSPYRYIFFIYFIQIIVIVKHILENTLGHKNSTQMRGIDAMILSFVRLAILLGLKNAANVESKNYWFNYLARNIFYWG